jgi:glutathione S-transferase
LVGQHAGRGDPPAGSRPISSSASPGDRAYYRSSREAAFGCTLEEYCADRPRWLAEFAAVIAPLERTLAEQTYLTGASPGYADYIVFSVFQYARLGCPDEFLDEGTALWRWRAGLVQAFDGLGDRYPGYPRLDASAR